MAFGQEAAVEQLSRELLAGYSLNARLLALLGKPLDCHGQGAAVAMIQELSGVFTKLMASLFRLKSGGDTSGNHVVDMSLLPTESRHELTPHRKVRGEEVITEQITASPFKDGYQWRKYGQKNIQNREFERFYYRCMHSQGLGCRAKKQVQKQDNSSGSRPMYQVTYVNEHTCHQVHPNQNISAPPTWTPTDNQNNTSRTRSGHFDHPHAVDVELENNMMTLALATVIRGPPSSPPPPPPPVEGILSDPATPYAAGYVQSPLAVSMIQDGSQFPPVDQPPAAPSLPVVQESSGYPAGGGNLPSIDDPLFSPVAAPSIDQYYCWEEMMHMAVVTQFPDTTSACPQY